MNILQSIAEITLEYTNCLFISHYFVHHTIIALLTDILFHNFITLCQFFFIVTIYFIT